MQEGKHNPQALLGMQSGTSSVTPCSNVDATEIAEKRKSLKQQQETAFADLSKDLEHLDDDDEYLTVTLEQEFRMLKQYKSALNML